jgi:hypothetical protein
MLPNFTRASLGCAFSTLTLPLLVACSAAPGDGTNAISTTQASQASQGVTDERAAYCDAYDPCSVGYYCAPTDGADVCGAGSCTASPSACPMIDMPVCGCDGNTYLNACWATIGQSGSPGTTSAGSLFLTPTMSSLVGTWSRETGWGRSKVVEKLFLGNDASYTLTESTGCGRGEASSACSVSESSGSFALTTVGILLEATTSPNAAELATEFYFENTCPIGGPPQLVGAEPPGSGTMVTLTQD